MNFTTLLVVLDLIGIAWSFPVSQWTCPAGCTLTHSNRTHQPFKHLRNGHETSVAPWSLEDQTEDGREPYSIKIAKCMACSIGGMKSEEIQIKIDVYKMSIAGTPSRWCKCPLNITVGCTCVPS